MGFSTFLVLIFIILLGIFSFLILALNKSIVHLDLLFLELDFQLGYMILSASLLGILIAIVLEMIFLSFLTCCSASFSPWMANQLCSFLLLLFLFSYTFDCWVVLQMNTRMANDPHGCSPFAPFTSLSIRVHHSHPANRQRMANIRSCEWCECSPNIRHSHEWCEW